MQRTRPPSGSDNRAQTVQDFAVGISLFLLTVGFVFAFVPSLFTPFQSDVTPGSASQADRVASTMVRELSADARPNWLDRGPTEDMFQKSESDLQDRYSLPSTSQINVTVVPLNGTTPVTDGGVTFAAGDEYRDRPAASVSRVVVVKSVDQCDPRADADSGKSGVQGMGCRLVVRIW